MSSFSKNSEKLLVSFLTKTLSILENPAYHSVISWDPSGKMIEIRNEREFEDQILSQQFKHKNIKSFIRQLNMYGFKKVKKGIAKNSFCHPHFNQYSKDDLKLIKRRKNCRSTPITDENLPPVGTKINQICSKLGGSSDTLLEIGNQGKQVEKEEIQKQKFIQAECVDNDSGVQINPQFEDTNNWNYLSEEMFPFQNQYSFPILSDREINF